MKPSNNRRCYTTGVLNRNIATNFAHIEVANFSDTAQRVFVTVYDWDLNPVTPVPNGTFSALIPPLNNAVFSAAIPAGVIHYEVRLNLPTGPDVDIIANIFGVTGGILDPNLRANQEGNTVLFNDLIVISNENCMGA